MELDDARTQLLLAKNRCATLEENFANIRTQLTRQIADLQQQQRSNDDGGKQGTADVEMAGTSEAGAGQAKLQDMVGLDTLKNLIIDQEVLLTTYTDQWEIIYTDLSTCVKIMLSMEKKKGEAESNELHHQLEAKQAQLNKVTIADQQHQQQITVLHERL